jgi:hypothetical protein
MAGRIPTLFFYRRRAGARGDQKIPRLMEAGFTVAGRLAFCGIE